MSPWARKCLPTYFPHWPVRLSGLPPPLKGSTRLPQLFFFAASSAIAPTATLHDFKKEKIGGVAGVRLQTRQMGLGPLQMLIGASQ